jgi:ubiquinone/menaquinone biosynthesis C-methylase UbiE
MTMSADPVLPAYSLNRATFPWMYERSLVEPLFRPWADALLDRADLTPGLRLIDVACGTGIVVRRARQRLNGAGRFVGVDVSAPMLDVAREVEPQIDWRVGDAAALPVGQEERFDRVLCQQGLQFFAQRAAAVAEWRRVVAPDGRILVAVWRAANEMPPFDALQREAELEVGSITDQRYAFGDASALERLLGDARFRDVRSETLALTMRFPDGVEFLRMNAMALVGMSGTRLGETEQQRVLDAIVTRSAEVARPFFDGPALVCEMRANLAVALPG